MEFAIMRVHERISREQLEKIASNFQPFPIKSNDGKVLGMVGSVRISGDMLLATAEVEYPGVLSSLVRMPEDGGMSIDEVRILGKPAADLCDAPVVVESER